MRAPTKHASQEGETRSVGRGWKTTSLCCCCCCCRRRLGDADDREWYYVVVVKTRREDTQSSKGSRPGCWVLALSWAMLNSRRDESRRAASAANEKSLAQSSSVCVASRSLSLLTATAPATRIEPWCPRLKEVSAPTPSPVFCSRAPLAACCLLRPT